MEMIYLDSNATSRPLPEVVAAMQSALTEHWFNPSSVHRPGQTTRRQVELAREDVAGLLNCRPREIVFTSGGTESDNWAIHGSLALDPKRRVLVTNMMEHSAIRETAKRLEERGHEVIWLRIDASGVVSVEHLQEIVSARADEIALVSVMWANNETGAIQPMARIAAICREHGVRLHSDGVQAVGKIPIDLAEIPADLVSFAAHKFHGPKGVGGLFIRRGTHLPKQVTGGPHERDLRAGTENVPGMMGMGAAARSQRAWLASDGPRRQEALRDRLEQGIVARCEDAVVNAAAAPRVWNTSNIGFGGLESEAILLMLSEKGLCAAAGAACVTGSLEPSIVLTAMGVSPRYAHGSVRFSLSRSTTDEDVDRALEIVPEVIGRLRRHAAVI